jgi:predicted transcriptional regulator
MAEITLKDLWAAFEAAAHAFHGEETDPGEEQIRNAFDEWLGEDRVDLLGEEDDTTEDEVIESLDLVYELLDTARQELVDEALGGNIARKHHLESAVAAFADIGTLLRAEEVIRQVLDVREH